MRWPDGPVVGYSLDPDALRVAAASAGVELVYVGTDQDATAPLSQRGGLVEALVRVGVVRADCLIVGAASDLGDRLHWPAVAQVVESLDAQLLSAASDGPDDEAELTARTVGDAKSAMAEHRRLAHAVDVRIGHREREGQRKSRFPPYGYSFAEDGALVEVVDELKTLVRMQELQAEERSYRQISAALNAEGLLARSGRPFAPSTVRQVLKRSS